MRFELTEDQKMIQEMVRRFAEDAVAPGAQMRDEQSVFAVDLVESLGELGLLGMMISEEYGGTSLGMVSTAITVEELARRDASLGLAVSSHNALFSAFVELAGSSDQKARLLSALATGESLGAWALQEGSGDVRPEVPHTLQVRAQRSGDWWTLTGQKSQVVLGAEADVFVVFARSVDRPFGEVGLSAFVLESGAEGLHIEPDTQRLGLRAGGLAKVNLEELTIEGHHAVGRPGGAKGALEAVLAQGLVGEAAVCVGLARACLEDARSYALERSQFKKPIANFQAIQWMLADMAMECDAARLLVLQAAQQIDRGLRKGRDVLRAASQAKLFASEAAVRAGMKAIQIYGGNGYVREYQVERYLRDARALTVAGASSERSRGRIAQAVLQ